MASWCKAPQLVQVAGVGLGMELVPGLELELVLVLVLELVCLAVCLELTLGARCRAVCCSMGTVSCLATPMHSYSRTLAELQRASGGLLRPARQMLLLLPTAATTRTLQP